MLSSVQQPHKSNHGKSLNHSHQEIRVLINLGAAFQNKLRVAINPFVAQGLLLTRAVCPARREREWVQTADLSRGKAEG